MSKVIRQTADAGFEFVTSAPRPKLESFSDYARVGAASLEDVKSVPALRSRGSFQLLARAKTDWSSNLRHSSSTQVMNQLTVGDASRCGGRV